MKNSIAIITDSTNDLPENLRQEYGIQVVPLTIVWGNDQYLDGVDITPEEFYSQLGQRSEHPTTSQPTPEDFRQAYEEARSNGAKKIMVITISSAMSGTLASARAAAADYPLPVYIVDSKANSMSLGWQILAAARARESGLDVEGMKNAVEAVRLKLHYHIVLDTMEYLYKGGRIGGATKFLGGILDIKPQIRVNHDSGMVESGENSRTRTRALETLYSGFFKKLDLTKPLRIAVLHNAALEEATAIAKRITDEFHPVELIIGIVSPVLGVHTGPKAIALCGYSEG